MDLNTEKWGRRSSEAQDRSDLHSGQAPAKKYIAQVFQPGIAVGHSKFGKGCISEVNAPNFTVKFASGEEKQLDAISCVANALITLENSEVQLRLNDYKNILGQARKIRDSIANAEKALLPYVEYLE